MVRELSLAFVSSTNKAESIKKGSSKHTTFHALIHFLFNHFVRGAGHGAKQLDLSVFTIKVMLEIKLYSRLSHS